MKVRRPLRIEGNTIIIPLTKGRLAYADIEDLPLIEGRNWCVSGGGYAGTSVQTDEGIRIRRLHRVVMKAPQGLEVDHIDGDKLNCRKANLRICTHRENMGNQRPPSGKTSAFKGVSRAGPNHWQASIRIAGRTKALGWYRSATDAACAYDLAALEAFGDFACTNVSLGLLTDRRDAA